MKNSLHKLFVGVSLSPALVVTLCTPAFCQVTPQSPGQPVESGMGGATQDAVAAAPEGNASIGDIVVTAQRTSQSLQRTPVAITAMSGGQLASRQITDIQKLSTLVPNFNFAVYGAAAKLSIRGLSFDSFSPGAESRVAYYVDGIYISRPAAVLGSFYDVDRVEVLRGPQGTLYGRNAIGGAAGVYTQQPTEKLSGYYRQTAANYGEFVEQGAVSGALANGVTGRLAFDIEDQGGYGRNLATGHDIDNKHSQSFRGKLKFELASNFNVIVSANYYHRNDQGNSPHYVGQGNPNVPFIGPAIGGTVPVNPRDTNQDYDPIDRARFWGGSLLAKWDLGDGITANYLGGYGNTNYVVQYDGNGMSGDVNPFSINESSHSISQELQLSRKGRALDWLIGAYYFNERVDGFTRVPFRAIEFGGSRDQFLKGYGALGILKTNAEAVFGQATYRPLEHLSLTFGWRYGREHRNVRDGNLFDNVAPYTGDPTVRPWPKPGFDELTTYQAATKLETSFTPRFNIQYEFNSTVQIYATVAKGYKSGGYDLGAATPAYNPEKLWDYEGGVKATFLDGKLRTNLATFYYDYSNLQVSLVKGLAIVTENAASARIWGLEGEITALPAPRVQLDLSGGYLNARFTNYNTVDPSRPELGELDLTGNRLPQSPRLSGTAGIQYKLEAADGSAVFRIEGVYQGATYFTPFNVKTNYQSNFAKINASINLTNSDQHWNAVLFARNVTGKRTLTNAVTTTAYQGYSVVGYFDEPARYGLTVGYRF